MKTRNPSFALAVAALCAAAPAPAMNHNLLMPWTNPPRCSPPQTPLFAFYNRQNADMMFRDGPGMVEIWCQAAVRTGSGLSWTLSLNRVAKPFLSGMAEALPGNLFRIALDASSFKPGFYDLKVRLEGLGHEKIKLFEGAAVPPTGICTFGWKPDEMPLPDEAAWRPADFDAFWEKAMADYRAAAPLDLKVEDEPRVFKGEEIDRYNVESACLPPNFDPEGARFDEVVSCKVSFAGPDGGRVYGWMARPAAEGRYPAILVLPGAGTGGRPRPLDHARHGYVALDLQVHGLDVDVADPPRYPWYNAPHDSFPDEMPPPEKFFPWFDLYRRALRGVDALAALPCADPEKIAVCGGSQGGRLSIAVAALDKRVKAAVPCIANSPNMPHQYWVARCNGRKQWWAKAPVADPLPEPVDGLEEYGAFPVPATPEARVLAYFDPINFAPRATCPAFFNGGLVDPVSPAYSTYAAFLRWGAADKAFAAAAGHGHDWWSAFDRAAWRWLDRELR